MYALLGDLVALDGRISRMRYFGLWASLFVASLLACVVVVGVLGRDAGKMSADVAFWVTLWPNFALFVKRLHDRNRSALFLLLLLIPILNVWVLFEVFICKGTDGRNDYGSAPL